MNLYLHSPAKRTTLSDVYSAAFADAVELYVVSAYLTDWNEELKLGSKLKSFRFIVGKDFGITRKLACLKVLKWLPASRKADFLVADNIQGFHPKAIFWIAANGKAYSLIGSSNLTRAAFSKNYEANVFTPMSEDDYKLAKAWIKEIESKSVGVTEDWIERYVESKIPIANRSTSPGKSSASPVIYFSLARPPDTTSLLNARRLQLKQYKKKQKLLIQFFRDCANRKISSEEFFSVLPKFWDMSLGNRLQGKGWERRGKVADFHALASSFLRILDAAASDRDDVAVFEMDSLASSENPARKAFLSEMLCLAFPSYYPVLNKPVADYLKAMKFRSPKGASEGAKYIDLARKLRSFLTQNPQHPAKTLAEIDTLIWRIYGNAA